MTRTGPRWPFEGPGDAGVIRLLGQVCGLPQSWYPRQLRAAALRAGAELDGVRRYLGSENTDRYKPEGLHVGSNAHWKPQRFHCSLEKFLTKYQFIGRYESLRDHAEMLLRSLNLWDAYGSKGWGHRDKRQRLMPKPSDSIPVRDSLFAQKAKHSTNAGRAQGRI